MWNITPVKYMQTESRNGKIKKSDKNSRARPLSRKNKRLIRNSKSKISEFLYT